MPQTFLILRFLFTLPMTLYSIAAQSFKLDGGAMFGVVPKTLWNKTNPADAQNRIELAARCLLIEEGNRLILIDTGLGDKQSEAFFKHYALWDNNSLEGSLKNLGFHNNDITDVFFTHLHLDHCGGAAQWNKNRTGYEPTFKNANYWTNQAHWQWALHPNAREKPSFRKENLLPLQESGQLCFVQQQDKPFIANSELNFGIHFVDGHTEKQMLPQLQYQGKTVVFAADLVPTVGHIPLPYILGYDVRPLVSLQEKAPFLEQAAKNNWFLFLGHDPYYPLCTVKHTEKGVRLHQTYAFDELFSS